MTNTPGSGGDQPQDPYQPPTGQPGQPGQPGQAGQPPGGQGYWEQQAQQPPPPAQYNQPGYGGQPGYAQQPAYGQQPVYALPDHPRSSTSLILGILGIVLCGILAPFAWVIGKRTVDEIDASNGQLGGRGAAQAGYIMGIIGSIWLALGLLIGIFVVIVAIVAAGSASS